MRFLDVFENETTIYDIKRIIWIRKRFPRLGYLCMIQKWIVENRFIDITSLHVGAATSEIKKTASILDVVIKYLLTSASSKI